MSFRGNFWSHVNKTETCWLWTGKKNRGGYGVATVKNRQYMAHRITYETLIGPIPGGLQIDHLCRVRHCVNPAHMEPVTLVVNVMRGVGFAPVNKAKTHCPRGHDLEIHGKSYSKKHPSWRNCRICAHENRRRTGPRKTCPNGHPYPTEHALTDKHHRCLTCTVERCQRRLAARAAQRLSQGMKPRKLSTPST